MLANKSTSIGIATDIFILLPFLISLILIIWNYWYPESSDSELEDYQPLKGEDVCFKQFAIGINTCTFNQKFFSHPNGDKDSQSDILL